MKKQLTVREKVLMCILAVLLVICAYYYAFYTPVLQKVATYKGEIEFLEEQNKVLDAQVEKMNLMKAELEAITSGEMGEVNEIPAYDNSYNVLNSLSAILEKAVKYQVNFVEINQEENIVRRNINMTYYCSSYENAKSIFEQIHDSEYRTLIKDVNYNHSDSGELPYSVTLTFTYFEYK